MSRRSRRRRISKSGKNGKSWWLRGFVALLLLLTLGMAGSYVWLRTWLHSEDFRRMLSAEASQQLGAETEFGQFSWDGTVVTTSSFDADGLGLLQHLKAEGMSLDIGLGKVRQQVLVLRDMRLNDLEIDFDLRSGMSNAAAVETVEVSERSLPMVAKKAPWYARFLPNEIELTGLDIGESSVRLLMNDGETAFSGTRWALKPDQGKGNYMIFGTGGRLTFPWKFLPPLDLKQTKMRYQDHSIFLTESKFSLFHRGELDLVGEASLRGEGFSFEGKLRDVRGNEVLPEDWSQRLMGDVESEFTVRNRGRGVMVSGQLRFLNGVLTGLPVLDYLGAYGGNPRFRRLSLSVAQTDFEWEDGAFVFRNFVLGSEGLMRVEGQLRVDPEKRIDGRFRVGLTPGTLAVIPGAETRVFLPGERGLLWAPLHLTGTLDDPKEDLSLRLLEAAGLRMFEILPETGERVLKYTQQVIDGDLLGALESGEQLIGQGSQLIDQGRNLLDGDADVVGGALEMIKQGEDVVHGVQGIFDIVRGKRQPEPLPLPPPNKEPEKPESGEKDQPLPSISPP